MDTQEPAPTITPRFDLQRLYVKEQSCKLPHAPAIFRDEWKPEVQLEMNIKHDALSPTLHEVNLRLTITAKNQQRTAFLLEVQQAGVFVLEHITEEQRNLFLQAHCPTILYPYARKVVADAVYAAGFPPLMLTPINFEALYHQQQQQSKATDKTNTLTTIVSSKAPAFAQTEETPAHESRF